MKYLYNEESPAEKKRLVFALGEQEALLIFGMLENAVKYTPKTFETQFDVARIHDMYYCLRPLAIKLNKLDYTENKPKKINLGEDSPKGEK